jgi:hypothetical protein
LSTSTQAKRSQKTKSPGTPNQPTKSQKIPKVPAVPAPLIINQPNPINTNPTKLREPIKNTPAPRKGNLPPTNTKAPNLTRNPINHQNQNHTGPNQVNHVPLPKQKQNPAALKHTKAKRKKKVLPIPHPILPGLEKRAHINRIPTAAVVPIKNTNPLLIQKREPLLLDVLIPAPLPVQGLIGPAATLLINPRQDHLTNHRHRTNTHPVNPIPGRHTNHLHLINHLRNPTAGHPRNLLTGPAADHHPGVPRVVHLLPGAPRHAVPQRKSNNNQKKVNRINVE